MTHKEQLITSIEVADTQAYAIIDERRDAPHGGNTAADIDTLREVRQLLRKARNLAKQIED